MKNHYIIFNTLINEMCLREWTGELYGPQTKIINKYITNQKPYVLAVYGTAFDIDACNGLICIFQDAHLPGVSYIVAYNICVSLGMLVSAMFI